MDFRIDLARFRRMIRNDYVNCAIGKLASRSLKSRLALRKSNFCKYLRDFPGQSGNLGKPRRGKETALLRGESWGIYKKHKVASHSSHLAIPILFSCESVDSDGTILRPHEMRRMSHTEAQRTTPWQRNSSSPRELPETTRRHCKLTSARR